MIDVSFVLQEQIRSVVGDAGSSEDVWQEGAPEAATDHAASGEDRPARGVWPEGGGAFPPWTAFPGVSNTENFLKHTQRVTGSDVLAGVALARPRPAAASCLQLT